MEKVKNLELFLKKDVSGHDYKTNRSFKFDLMHVLLNGFTIPMKGVDPLATEILNKEFSLGKRLYIEQRDSEFEGNVYDQFVVLVNDEEIQVVPKQKTGKKIISKYFKTE